jgi:uncharacterized membrane protein
VIRKIFRWILAVFFIAAGINHFVNPDIYLSMMPPYLPWHEFLNYASGAAEVIGGVAVLFPASRIWGGWLLLAVLVAVFPANLQVAIAGWPELDVPRWALWARLPLQPVLMAWVYFTCLRPKPTVKS